MLKRISDDEIREYAKDEDCRGYPIQSGWLTDEVMEHVKDILQAQLEADIKVLKEVEKVIQTMLDVAGDKLESIIDKDELLKRKVVKY